MDFASLQAPSCFRDEQKKVGGSDPLHMVEGSGLEDSDTAFMGFQWVLSSRLRIQE